MITKNNHHRNSLKTMKKSASSNGQDWPLICCSFPVVMVNHVTFNQNYISYTMQTLHVYRDVPTVMSCIGHKKLEQTRNDLVFMYTAW